MYERNAIIIERYFDKLFGYNLINNIKVNFSNYCGLIDASERYKEVSEEEEEIIIEYDIIANKIREIQKKQENLNKRNIQFQQERNELFQNIDEDANLIQKSMDKVNNNISAINEEIRENAIDFTKVVAEFNEKSIVRDKCGKKRRVIEKEYNNKLNDTLDNYKNIDIDLANRAKQFIELDSTEIEAELKNIIKKNGEKEKVPFNTEIVEQAIIVSIDVQKRETDILSNIYEKTNKLFSEIKNNSIKIEKHKKFIVDSKCKLNFISAIKEYLIQYLDNERLAALNGENEYTKLMEEACKNIKDDLIQINNLYVLLVKEITKKATRKAYVDLYNIEYLKKLEEKGEEFEKQVKKLKLPVAIIDPNHWRIDGMKRIYEVFNKSVIEEYGRDLKEFANIDIDDEDSDQDDSVQEKDFKEYEIPENIEINNNKEKNDDDQEDEDIEEDKIIKNDIDRKIDIILGIEEDDTQEKTIKKTKNNKNEAEIIEENDEDWESDLDSFDDDGDFEDDETFTDEAVDELFEKGPIGLDENKEDDSNTEYFDDDLIDLEDLENEDFEDLEDEIEIQSNENDDYEEEADYDIWGNNITKKNGQQNTNHNRKNDDDWGNEYINIENKEKNQKSKFFNKFKR